MRLGFIRRQQNVRYELLDGCYGVVNVCEIFDAQRGCFGAPHRRLDFTR